MIGLVYRSIQMMLTDLSMKESLVKTECCYIIDAKPGAEIIYGHNAKSKEELRQQIESKDWGKSFDQGSS